MVISQNRNESKEVKETRVTRSVKKKLPTEGYKWPYYDSYAPGLGMDDKDRKIVRRGIQRQYFPNEHGNFNIKDLNKRKKGIKKIEHQYIDRIKSASSPDRRGNHNTSVTYTSSKVRANVGLFKQHLLTPVGGKNINIRQSGTENKIVHLGDQQVSNDMSSLDYNVVGSQFASQTIQDDFTTKSKRKVSGKVLT